MSAPLVSIVIPTYNYGRFLEPALRSLCRQDWPELELVVVDDCSSDDTMARLAALREDPEISATFAAGGITIEANPVNRGAHETINRAIGLSRGDFIAILNADDAYAPRRIATMMEAMRPAGARLAFSLVRFMDERGQLIDQLDPMARRLRHRQAVIHRYPTVGFACLASNVAISTGNFLFERGLYAEAGPFSALKYCHDWQFLLRALLVTEPLYVEAAHYLYRIHGANSFRSLAGVADMESRMILRDYLRAAASTRVRNPRAPTARNWPGVFETMVDIHGLAGHME